MGGLCRPLKCVITSYSIHYTKLYEHRLPNVPAGHKCARMHGHSFRIEIHVSGEVGPESGWVMDFADLRRAFQPLFDQLDHHCLNDIDGLSNPTSENLARWIWERLLPALPQLSRVVVQETCIV